MAGSITKTYEQRRIEKIGKGKVCEIVRVSWEAGASGAFGAQDIELEGFLLKALTIPGSTTPSNEYNVVLGDPDDNSFDSLQGALTDRSNATTEEVYTVVSGATIPIFLAGNYKLDITDNTESNSGGTIVFYLIDG